MAGQPGVVIGGVDTHKHTHHAAVIDGHGQLLGDRQFATELVARPPCSPGCASHGEIAPSALGERACMARR